MSIYFIQALNLYLSLWELFSKMPLTLFMSLSNLYKIHYGYVFTVLFIKVKFLWKWNVFLLSYTNCVINKLLITMNKLYQGRLYLYFLLFYPSNIVYLFQKTWSIHVHLLRLMVMLIKYSLCKVILFHNARDKN